MQEVLPLNRQLECRHVLMLVTGNGYKSVCDCVCCVCDCVCDGRMGQCAWARVCISQTLLLAVTAVTDVINNKVFT